MNAKNDDIQMEVAGRKHEMTTEGGEVSFVKKIINESRIYRTNVKIFTAMLGRKKSAAELKNYILNIAEVQSVSVSEFCQGRIMRWGLSWTFHSNIKLDKIVPSNFMISKQEKKKNEPFILSLDYNSQYCDSLAVLNIITDLVVNELSAKSVKTHKVEKHLCSIQFALHKPTWRNQRAKRRKEDRMIDGPSTKRSRMEVDEDINPVLLLDTVVTITCIEQETDPKIEIQFVCKNGELGRGGLYELVQYFKNKLIPVVNK